MGKLTAKDLLKEVREIKKLVAKLSSSVSEEDIFRLLKKYGKVQTFFPKSGKFKGSTNFELSVPKYELSISIYITPKGYVAQVSDLNGYYEETFKGTLSSVDALVRRSVDIARQAWEENYRRDRRNTHWY